MTHKKSWKTRPCSRGSHSFWVDRWVIPENLGVEIRHSDLQAGKGSGIAITIEQLWEVPGGSGITSASVLVQMAHL